MSSQVKFSSCSSSSLEEVVVQLSNHAHNVTTAVQMVMKIVVTIALSAWSTKIGAIRSQKSCRLLRDNAVLGALLNYLHLKLEAWLCQAEKAGRVI